MYDTVSEHPHKVIMTGMHDPRATSDLESFRNRDIGEQFWTDERRALAKNVWESVSNEMHRRFGVEPLEYQEDVLRIVEMGENTGEMASYSGQIYLDRKRVSDPKEFVHALAHEMGHFYARRQILAKDASTNFGATMQSGLDF